MERDDLVTICTVTNPTEAEIIRIALDSAGIASEIGGEGQGGFAGVWQIDILTQAEHADEARKHLRQLRRNIKLRRKRRAEARKAKKAEAAAPPSDAIQDLNRSTDITEPGEQQP